MKVSICTLTARRGYLENMMQMIAAQKFEGELEWVLIDFVYEERVQTLRDLAKELHLDLKHHPNVRDHRLFFRDITRNRNKALQMASGDYVIFLDDYAVIRDSFVANHLLIMQDGGISAGNMHRRECQTESNIFDLTENVFETIFKEDTVHIGKDYRNRGHNYYSANGITYTGNLGIPRAIFEHLNGFDPRMESGLEDCDFGHRATIAGYATVFNPLAETINLNTDCAPYVYSFDHAHDVEPFISNPNNHFAGDATLEENEFMNVFFDKDNIFRLACCKICGATGMIDPNELIHHKHATKEFQVPAELPGGYS